MKHLILTAALVAASVVFGDYYEWSNPYYGYLSEDVAWTMSVSGKTIPLTFKRGDAVEAVSSKLDEAIAASDLSENAKNAFRIAQLSLAHAIHADLQTEAAELEISALSASIEALTKLANAQQVDSAGNVISQTSSAKLRDSLVAAKNAILGGDSTGGAGTTGSATYPLKVKVTEHPYNETQFEQVIGENRSKMSLKNSYKVDNEQGGLGGASAYFYGSLDYFLPVLTKYGNDLEWVRYNGWDASVFEADYNGTTGQYDGQLTLKDFHKNSACSDNLTELMKDDSTDSDRKYHWFLTKYKKGGAEELHWMAFGDRFDGGNVYGADTYSTDLEVDESDTSVTNIVVHGFKDAAAAVSAASPWRIPVAENENCQLGWIDPTKLFSDKVFTKTSTGKIILNGVNEDAEKVRVLAFSGNQDTQELKTFGADERSVDFNSTGGTIQLHGFDNVGAHLTNTDFANMLTNSQYTITGISVPLAVGAGAAKEIMYAPLAKITGIPSANVDDKTLEVDDSDKQNPMIRIKGAAEAINGQILAMGENGVAKWISGNADIQCNEEYGDESMCPIYLATESGGVGEEAKTTTTIDLKNWDAEAKSLYGTDAQGKPKLFHLSDSKGLEVNSSGHLDIKGITTGGGCDVTLHDVMTKTDEATNRAKHQILTRYTDDGEVHWMSLGAKLNEGGGGAALRFHGTDGSSCVAGYGSRTNNVTFASESDSNVKVRVTGSGDDVTINIGVYYK